MKVHEYENMVSSRTCTLSSPDVIRARSIFSPAMRTENRSDIKEMFRLAYSAKLHFWMQLLSLWLCYANIIRHVPKTKNMYTNCVLITGRTNCWSQIWAISSLKRRLIDREPLGAYLQKTFWVINILGSARPLAGLGLNKEEVSRAIGSMTFLVTTTAPQDPQQLQCLDGLHTNKPVSI